MPPPRPTPEELLAGVAAREASALAALVDLEAPELLAVARQILSNPKDAAAAVEDVLVQLSKEAPELEQHGASVRAWLTLSTRAIALDRRRESEQAAEPRPRRPCRISAACLPPPQTIRLLDERRELLKKIMRQLPRRQCEVLSLAVFEGRSEAEIASLLGEPLGRVTTEMRAALRFLRHRLRAVLGEWTANI